MRPAHILVIEDDSIVSRTIERSLDQEQFRVTVANRGDKGLLMARSLVQQGDKPDLALLDIIMPDIDGYAVCRAMRSDPALAEIPILFLTAKVKTADRIGGFLAGGDDYLCKPFNIDELILRIQAILRRTRRLSGNGFHPAAANEDPTKKPLSPYPSAVNPYQPDKPSNNLIVGHYSLDPRSFELTLPGGTKILLTPLQFDLLYHLMTHPGEAFPPGRLLDEVWDFPAGKGSLDLVRVHIKTLRERIEVDPRVPTFLRTIPGKGYAVIPPGAE